MDIQSMIVPAYATTGINKVRMLIFGPPKCGKTTWIAHNAPKPIIIDVEKGTVSLLNDPIVRATPTFPYYQRDKLLEFLDFLRSPAGNQFETVVIDTLTEWQAKLLDGVIKAAGRVGDTPQIQDYGIVGNVMRRIIVELFEMDKHFIVTAHTQDRSFGEMTKTAPALPPKVANTVEGLFPIIAYMTKRTTREGIKVNMQFVDTPTLVAGNRLQLPQNVDNPDFQFFLDKLPKES
jgi:phage nucleotide-binding protein